ncbi:MAG: type IV pilus assembly protein PilM [Patescibacteria group bacterium]
MWISFLIIAQQLYVIICYNKDVMQIPIKDFSDLKKKILGSGASEKALGVDIGSSTIKIIQLAKEKEQAILQTYGELALGPYGEMEIGRSVKIADDKIVEALKDVIREANVKTKIASVAIPLKSSFVTVVNIPRLVNEKRLAEVIQMEARRYIPLPISEVLLDWWIFPDKEVGSEETEKEKKFIKILLVAIHKNVIGKYKNIITKAGLEIGAFELESFSMLRSALFRETAPVAVIDFGASTTKIAIADYGMMRSAHSINKGSQDLTLALSNSLQINFKRAEEIKRDIGLSNLPEHREITSILEPILNYIFSEVNSVIKDFQVKYNQSVKRIVMTGGGSLMKGLINFAVKRTTLEVNLADPFVKTHYPAFLEKVLKGVGPDFSIAIGLALRELI